ncbi:MAG: SBBP repeat-containing protein [Nitrospirae bacterium]|nr:SBBP repeat-containing protein [Nitrospirota bacterium]
MSVRSRAVGVALVLFSLIVVPPLSSADAATARPPLHPPLDFEINQGQTDPHVTFLSRGPGHVLFLTADGAVMRLASPRTGRNHAASAGRAAAVKMTWLGASPRSAIEGLDPLPAKSHYFIGNDPARWRTNVSHYAKVRYRGLYPGIDLMYYCDSSNTQQVEYDLVVEPGADPRAIRVAVEGVSAVTLDQRGDLLLTTGGGVITQRRPVVYQEIDGVRRPVAGSYVVQSSANRRHEIGFSVASYDVNRPLIIDPVLALSTYWGGSGHDEATAVAVNIDNGDIFLAGFTDSDNFPVSGTLLNGVTHAFLTRLNAAGTAVTYSAYLGGTSDDTQALGLDVDGSGSAYLTGFTKANDFPVFPNDSTTNTYAYQLAPGGLSDAFVAKLDPRGTVAYATYLGGTGADQGNGIKISGTSAYVVGTTESGDFPTHVPLQDKNGGGEEKGKDVFLSRLNAAGTALIFSTYFGGKGTDEGLALAVGFDGTAVVTGSTNSGPFTIVPASPPFQSVYGGGVSDALVARFSADGRTLLYWTYLGGDGADVGRAVTVDTNVRAYVTGETDSTTFPVTADALQPDKNGNPQAGNLDAFIARVDSSGKNLDYSTYLGGSEDDVGHGIALSPEDFIYVTGETASAADFPTLNTAQNGYGGGAHDAFVTRLEPNWQLNYSTYWGGDGDDVGRAIVVDVGVAHIVGSTNSTDMNTTANPLQGHLGLDGSSQPTIDGFLLSLEDDQPNGCNMGSFGGPFHSFGRLGRFDLGLPIVMGAAAGLWWLRRLRRVRR